MITVGSGTLASFDSEAMWEITVWCGVNMYAVCIGAGLVVICNNHPDMPPDLNSSEELIFANTFPMSDACSCGALFDCSSGKLRVYHVSYKVILSHVKNGGLVKLTKPHLERFRWLAKPANRATRLLRTI